MVDRTRATTRWGQSVNGYRASGSSCVTVSVIFVPCRRACVSMYVDWYRKLSSFCTGSFWINNIIFDTYPILFFVFMIKNQFVFSRRPCTRCVRRKVWTKIYVAVQIPVQMCGRTIEEMTGGVFGGALATLPRLLLLMLLALVTASRASDSCDWSGR